MKNEPCKGCHDHSGCESAYRSLGHSTTPPVTINVLAAFVLPLVTFVLALAVSQRIWAGLAPAKIMTLASFITALVATALITAGGAWLVRPTCNGQQETRQNG